MDVREKLVELLTNSPQLDVLDWTTGWEEAANYLIAHGVTIQEWIPVAERLPESGKESVLIALRWGEVDIGLCEDGRWRSEFVNEYEDGEVTHWMPLPKHPK